MAHYQINEKALLTDQTENFITRGKNGSVRIYLRTAKRNVENCILCIMDAGPEQDTKGEIPVRAAAVTGVGAPIPSAAGRIEQKLMRRAIRSDRDTGFDYYQAATGPRTKPFLYWFLITGKGGGDPLVYTRRGLSSVIAREEAPAGAWYLAPGFDVPDWAKGAVMYQIFTDRFANGDARNDVRTGEYKYYDKEVEHRDDWHSLPAADDIRTHYGGDLQGIIDKLDYLQDLGIEALYLNPVFLSPSNHKYDTQDYEHIDPHFGRILRDGDYAARVTSPENLEASDRLFARLVQEAHARGIRVILDGVFNHCGDANKWMDREGLYMGRDSYAPGAFLREKSPYHSYFKFTKENWPDPPEYESWWDVSTLPKLNYENSEHLTQEILDIAAKWVSPPFSADGWRLDVAADLGHSAAFNHVFWQHFRKVVKKANPDALILAENYSDSSAWLGGDEWDGIMNYEGFMEPVGWFLTGMEKHSSGFDESRLNDPEQFWHALQFLDQERIPQDALMVSMNELSNHDHARFLTRTNLLAGRLGAIGPDGEEITSADAEWGVRRAVFREAVVLQMTLPGAPTIYYGDEAGLCGFTDPDNRRPYPWGREDREMITLHRELIRIRHENSCLRNGSIVRLADAPGILSYGRFDKKSICVVALNNGDDVCKVRVPVWYAGVGTGKDAKSGADPEADSRPVQMEVLFQTDREGFSVPGEGRSKRRFKVRADGCIVLKLPPESAVILRAVPAAVQRS